LITLDSSGDFGGASGWLCADVDGQPAGPACPNVSQVLFSLRQNQYVPTGDHTVQLIAIPGDGQFSGSMGSWEVDYTVYELNHSVK
jgi:hypothetical protein